MLHRVVKLYRKIEILFARNITLGLTFKTCRLLFRLTVVMICSLSFHLIFFVAEYLIRTVWVILLKLFIGVSLFCFNLLGQICMIGSTLTDVIWVYRNVIKMVWVLPLFQWAMRIVWAFDWTARFILDWNKAINFFVDLPILIYITILSQYIVSILNYQLRAADTVTYYSTDIATLIEGTLNKIASVKRSFLILLDLTL